MSFNVLLTESLAAFILWSGESGAMGGPVSRAPASQLRPWHEYQVIMWVGDSAYRQPQKLPLFFQRLREMGVTAAMVHGVGADPQPLLANQFPYYVENIVSKGLCLKWNSRVRDWDKFVTAWAPARAEAARVAVYRYTLGKARLLAFERNINYHVSEDLKQAGGNQRLETPLALTATLAQAAHVYDLRRQTYLGHTSHVEFTLDPWQPALFAVLSEKAPPDTLIHLLGQQAGAE
jgi:hypothetical protein